MPRLELELSANLHELESIKSIVQEIVDEFSKFDSVDPAAVKCFANIHQHIGTGSGGKAGFIHLTICLLTGRSLQLRKEMSTKMATLLDRLFQNSRQARIAGITVEMREMEITTFTKLA